MEEDYRYYFHSAVPFKIGDKAAYNIGNSKMPIYKEVIIKSEPYIAPSGAQYIRVLLRGRSAAVPTFDLADINSVQITNRADIYSDRYGDRYYSRRGEYVLVLEDNSEILCRRECSGRKEANNLLLDKDILEKYKITHVYSKGILIWQSRTKIITKI